MFPHRLADEIRAALTDLASSPAPPPTGDACRDDIPIERPFDASWGDFGSPVALRRARSYARSPRQLAGELAARVRSVDGIEECEVAGEGFLNIRLDPDALAGIARAVVAAGPAFGAADDPDADVPDAGAPDAGAPDADAPDAEAPDADAPHGPPPGLVRELRYAHARMVGLLRAGRALGVASDPDPLDPYDLASIDTGALADPAPRRLVCALAEYPRIVRCAPARALDSYLHDLLGLVAQLEGTRRILPVGDEDPTPAHAALLVLVDGTRTVIGNVLHRSGISAPDRL